MDDIKAELIATKMVDNVVNREKKSNTAILKEVGYKPSVSTNTTKIINHNKVQAIIKQRLSDVSTKCLDKLESIASTVTTDKNMTAVMKCNQDLLDRAGYSKVTKHASIKAEIKHKDIDSIDKRIKQLEEQLK